MRIKSRDICEAALKSPERDFFKAASQTYLCLNHGLTRDFFEKTVKAVSLIATGRRVGSGKVKYQFKGVDRRIDDKYKIDAAQKMKPARLSRCLRSSGNRRQRKRINGEADPSK